MKKAFRLLIILMVLMFAGENIAEAQTNIFHKWKAKRIEKKMSGKKRKAPREKKIKEPRSVTKAKKDQAKREARLKKDYQKAVEGNRERHFEIQSDAVKERMKQNEKDIKAREKARRKAVRKAGREARKKYKK